MENISGRLKRMNEEMEFKRLGLVCRRQAAYKHLKEFYYDRQSNNLEFFDKYLPESHVEEFQVYMGKRNGTGRYRYLMISVNPMKHVSYEQFMKKVTKCKTKKWIEQESTCIEWTHDEIKDEFGLIDNGGMHMHMKIWIKKDKNPYECKREVYNTFKDLVEKQCVNVRYSNRDGCFDDYIKGLKGKEDKECMGYTRKYRKLYES